MNAIAKGEKNVSDWDALMKKQKQEYKKQDIWMNFTSNHDENAWNGTEYERMGDAAETFAALTYTMPGMPLIYTGQEYDFNRRLKFFEKDQITKEKGKMYGIYEKLGRLKNQNPALNGGKDPAAYNRIQTSKDDTVLAFERVKDGQNVIFVANLSKDKQVFTLQAEGEFTNYMTGEKIMLAPGEDQVFKPWQYWILTK